MSSAISSTASTVIRYSPRRARTSSGGFGRLELESNRGDAENAEKDAKVFLRVDRLMSHQVRRDKVTENKRVESAVRTQLAGSAVRADVGWRLAESRAEPARREQRQEGRRATERTALAETPLGVIGILSEGGVLTGVDLEPAALERGGGEVPTVVADRFRAYFADGACELDVPVELRGTPFQLRVWNALRQIPPGQTVTYGELAARLGTSARAVGGACRANPCPIVVPCHRVVARAGLGGFAGDTTGHKLAVKHWLLRHEGALSDEGSSVSEVSTK
jgi:methylated-DNA-[protein]-cysteine S-methyltransferase